MLKKLMIVFLATSLSAGGERPLPSTKPMNVGMPELLCAPERFDGKVVAVIGLFEMSRDGDLLYFHQEDALNWILADSVWIARSEETGKNRATLNHKYVKVIGTFKAGYKEQLGYPSNGFPEVQSIKVWSDPASPIGRKDIPGMVREP